VDDSTPHLPQRAMMIAELVTHVLGLLRGLERSHQVRELLAQAQLYEKVVKHWESVPPTPPQLEAMLDLVTELHEKAKLVKGR
jgi:hypothetical protein